MYIRTKSSPNSPRQSVQIVESSRVNGKPRQKILRHVGVADSAEGLRQLKRLAEYIKADIEAEDRNRSESFFSPEEMAKMALSSFRKKEGSKEPLRVDLRSIKEEQRCILGIHELYGRIYKELGFEEILGRRLSHRAYILKQVVLARLACPSSKKESVRFLREDFGVRLPLERVYRMMDCLDERLIKRLNDLSRDKTCFLLGKRKLDILFYDTTSLYFESDKGEGLRSKGYSKDGKPECSQVILALLVTEEGLPVGYKVFPGSSYEAHTLLPVLEELRGEYNVGRVVFVADRGLLNKENLKLLEEKGYDYVVGARLKSALSKKTKEKILDRKNYKYLQKGFSSSEGEFFYETSLPGFKDRRLVVTYNGKRARRDERKRGEYIERLRKKLKSCKELSSVLNGRGYKRFLKVKGSSLVELDREKIKEAARWDGLHGVITNLPSSKISIKNLLNHYRSLWQIEEGFRISKHDLRVRPIYHWTEKRIKAHLAYRYKLQYKSLSPAKLRQELMNIQATMLWDTKNNKKYIIPGKISPTAKNIYRTLGLNWNETPYQVKEKNSQK